MPAYLWFAALCLILPTTAAIHATATFQLTRGRQDTFTNPHCVAKHTVCSPSQCAQYFAKCETKSCTVCVCDEQTPTYFEKGCTKDDEIMSQTALRYSSFAISNPLGQHYITANTSSGQLGEESQYTANPNQLWLYTPSKKLMNLKTLECLDSGDPSGVVRLRPCTVVNSETQIWRCSSSHGLYVMKKGNRSYLDYSGLHFYTGGDKQVRKWIANKGTGVSSRSICDIPDSYKGAYRFTDGSLVKRLRLEFSDPPSKTCTGCYQTFSISAPIFSDGYSSTCYLRWISSYFSVNNQPWKTLAVYEDDFYYTGHVSPLGKGIIFRFQKRVRTVWAGSLMKLNIQCQDYNPNTTKTTYENHFILLKFDGVFQDSLEQQPTMKPTADKNKRGSLHAESRYKSAVIALSIVLAAVLSFVITAAVMIYRRQGTRTWVTANAECDISAKPFCNSEDQL